MEYLRKFKLPKKGKFLTAILKKKGLTGPATWKLSKRIIREASRPWLTGSRTGKRVEAAGLEDEEDTFLAREILQQINHSYHDPRHHFLHQKKSLKSVIEEAKSELNMKRLKLRQISLTAAGEDYVDFEEANRNILSSNSDYMDMY